MWRLNPVAKFACLAETRAVLNLVSFFPRTFITVHLFSKLPPFQTLCESIFKPHWCFISYPNHQEKVRVFAFSISFSLFLVILATVWVDIVFEIFLSLCNGYGVLCLLLFSFVFMLSGHNVLFHCSDICLLLSLKIFY